MGHGDTSCDPHLHQTVEQPTLHYLTRSVRRRAAWFKFGSGKLAMFVPRTQQSYRFPPRQPEDENGGGGRSRNTQAVLKTRKLLVFRDAKNVENGKNWAQLERNWNAGFGVNP